MQNMDEDLATAIHRRLSILESEICSLRQLKRTMQQEDVVFVEGDIAWMLTASALVLLMTLPALFLYYGGMARTKNVLSIIMQIFSITCVVSFLWLCFGYSLSFAPIAGRDPNASVYGDASRFWLSGLTLSSAHQLAPSIPESLFCLFELTFAVITPCLIVGAFADRMRYHALLLFVSLWHLAVYCPIAHAVWHPDGFLFRAGVLDFAGGNVVHVSSGFAGLTGCIYLGPRIGLGRERFDPHNILLTAMGAAMLWVGWLGFNGGSALAASPRTAYASLVTLLSSSVAALTWMGTNWLHTGRPSVLGMVSGAVAGLVCVTPACGYVNFTGAFVLGLLAGPVCYWGVQLKHLAGYDDALDAFGVHGIGGVLGGFLLGFLADPSLSPNAHGLFYSEAELGGRQLASQLYGIAISMGWSIAGTLSILMLVDLGVGLRVTEEEEGKGLDHSLHGETLHSGVDQVLHRREEDEDREEKAAGLAEDVAGREREEKEGELLPL